MTLTEAVQITSMMGAEACVATAFDVRADPMLREVCRWRNASHPKYLELAKLIGIGPRFVAKKFRRRADHESAMSCVARSVRAQDGATIDGLMARCGCSRTHVWTIMTRLRRNGMVIERVLGPNRGRFICRG